MYTSEQDHKVFIAKVKRGELNKPVVRGATTYDEWKAAQKVVRRRYYEANKARFKDASKKYRLANQALISKQVKQRYKEDAEFRQRIVEAGKRWRKNNKEKSVDACRKYRAKNPQAKIADRLRTYVRVVGLGPERTSMRGVKPSNRFQELVGCGKAQFKAYLEGYFKDGMSWDNYGALWNIDHCVPCCMFDLTNEDQQKKCFHYSNMGPKLKRENESKGQGIDF